MFFLLLGCPLPTFLSLCIVNMKAYVRKYNVSDRERKFYRIFTRILIAIIIVNVLLTLICVIE